MSNTRNLRKRRGGGWFAVIYVPAHLQKIVGKREIVRGLGTANLQEANRSKLTVIAAIQNELGRLANPKAEIAIEARGIAETFDPDDEGLDDAILANAHAIEMRHGEKTAVNYYKVATRQRLATSTALEMWMDEADGITEGTKVKDREFIEATVNAIDALTGRPPRWDHRRKPTGILRYADRWLRDQGGHTGRVDFSLPESRKEHRGGVIGRRLTVRASRSAMVTSSVRHLRRKAITTKRKTRPPDICWTVRDVPPDNREAAKVAAQLQTHMNAPIGVLKLWVEKTLSRMHRSKLVSDTGRRTFKMRGLSERI